MTNPYTNSKLSHKKQVALMFNNIAGTYDLLNHVLSFGIDKIWRKQAIKAIQKHSPLTILDIATGTGDFAILAAQKLSPEKIIGIDISEKMLEKGIKKIAKKHLSSIITLQLNDSEKMEFADNSFDATLTGFGVRNFENLSAGLSENYRVLKKDGVAAILEFSKPQKFPVKQLYFFYFKYILPTIGKVISKDYNAYKYLPESVDNFPYGKAFIKHAQQAGFKNITHKKLTCGIASLYICIK
ncbi:MAG: bifunctional demethylmenaquinone methyltransferase/2-methoxy-6-polyprenyl-1,4-benzoquinol methylase UbiE [Bacteroidales bacterium]